MTDEELDGIFKKNFEVHESAVPADMWLRITAKKRKKKFVIRLWLFFMIVFIITGIFYVTNMKFQKENLISKNIQPIKYKKTKPAGTGNTISAKAFPANLLKPFEPLKVINKKVSEENNFCGVVKKPFKPKSLLTGNDHFGSLKNEKGNLSGAAKINSTEKDSSQLHSGNKQDTAQKKNTSLQKDLLNDETVDENDKWFIEGFLSPAIPVNYIKSKNHPYETALQKSFSAKTSFTTGANIGYKINKAVAAKTGLYFTQVNELFSYHDSAVNTQTKCKNKYIFVNVPLLLTISKELNYQWRLSFTAGLIVNISSVYKGSVLSSPGGILNLKKDHVYESDVRANLYGGIALFKNFSKKISVFAEPYIRYEPKSITTQFQEFEQKINLVGLSIGLHYNLFNNKSK